LSPGRTTPAARLRGSASGALTAALAVAAHSTAGGGLPDSAAVALLALLAITLGTLVATISDRADVKSLVAVLSVGQLLGHAVLGAAGHSHPVSGPGAEGLMLAAHVGAIAVGAALIATGGRLCAAVSRTLFAATPRPSRPIAAVSATVVESADQPLHSALSLAASVSHRGPPVGFAH
jgi:hypothetical protein